MRKAELLLPLLLLASCRQLQANKPETGNAIFSVQSEEFDPNFRISDQFQQATNANYKPESAPVPISYFPKRHPKLCTRIEEPGDAALASEMRMQYVRVFMPLNWIGDSNSPKEIAMNEAVAQGMTPIFVFAPTEKIDKQLMQEKIYYILEKFPGAIIEILNEWDNPEVEFWKDRNPDTAAQMTAETLDFLATNYPDTRVVLGATVNPANLEQMLFRLKNVYKIDPSKLLIAGHAYNSEADINKTGWITLQIMDKYGIPKGHYILTELGATAENQANLPKLIDTALYGEYPASGACLHTINVHVSSGPTEKSFELTKNSREAVSKYADSQLQP